MTDLREMKCVACRSSEPPLGSGEIYQLQPQVPDWQVVERDGIPHLERAFKFKNFSEALNFTNKIGALAEEEDHHPLIVTEWGKVTLQWWTHKIGGLHRNDFIMAAKADALFAEKT
jgi:4a-hydroxytetrahydrobiopterin dehydratase